MTFCLPSTECYKSTRYLVKCMPHNIEARRLLAVASTTSLRFWAMEAAYSACNLNLFEKEIWHPKLYDSDLGLLFDEPDTDLRKSSLSKCDSIDGSVNRFKERSEFNGVTGEGVLLWLPPMHEASSCDNTATPVLQNDENVRNVFINICPTGQNGSARLATRSASSEMETKSLVNLMASRQENINTDDSLVPEDKPSFTDGEFVTVVDVSVESRLLLEIKTLDDVNFFCQQTLDYFRTSSALDGLKGCRSNKRNLSLIYKISKASLLAVDSAIIGNSDGEYQSESPKKGYKSRKAGRKSKRESTISGNEKRSRFTCNADIAAQIKVLGYQIFKASYLRASVIEQKFRKKDLKKSFKLMPGGFVNFEIDLTGVEIPSELKIDVIDNHISFRCGSGILDAYVRLKKPDHLVLALADEKEVDYSLDNDKLSLSLLVHDTKEIARSREDALHRTPSLHSGNGFEEATPEGFSFYPYSPNFRDFEKDQLSKKGLSENSLLQYLKLENLKSGQTVSTNGAHNKEETSGFYEFNSNWKCFCDNTDGIARGKAGLECKETLLPTYDISQTLEKIQLVICCGVGIRLETLEVFLSSPDSCCVRYINTAASCTPLRYCLHLSSIEVTDNHVQTCEEERATKCIQKFKLEKENEQNGIASGKLSAGSLLDSVDLSSGHLVLSINKSCPGGWTSVWAGNRGQMKKVLLADIHEQLVTKVPVPLRLTDSLGELPAAAERETGDRHPVEEDETSAVAAGPGDEATPEGEDTQTVTGDGESPPAGEDGKKKSAVNVNKKKKFGEVLSNKTNKDSMRTKNGRCEGATASATNSINNHSSDNAAASNTSNKKKINKAVKLSVSPIENKENTAVVPATTEQAADAGHERTSSAAVGLGRVLPESEWPARDSGVKQRMRRSSECIGVTGKTSSAKYRASPPLSGRPRSILKRRGRSFSESHIGSLEECLGEELLDKYGSAEGALVGEYGCLEGLLEECGWELEGADGDEDAAGVSVGSSKKSVRFNDVEKMHLFMSKTSIVNQLANDDKKAMRGKMKEQKRKMRIEKRQAQKNGGSFNSSYRSNSGYNSFDDDVTTEESDGAELCSSSAETTDNTTEDETDNSSEQLHDTTTTNNTNNNSSSSAVLMNRSSKGGGGKKKGRKSNKKKRVELTNNMIFQLDMEA